MSFRVSAFALSTWALAVAIAVAGLPVPVHGQTTPSPTPAEPAPASAAPATTSATPATASTAAPAPSPVPAEPAPASAVPPTTSTAAPSPAPTVELYNVPGLPGRAAAMLVSGPRGGTLRLSAVAVPENVNLGGLNFAIIVDVDTAGLLPDPAAGISRFLLAAYAVNADGKVVAETVYGLSLDAASGPALAGRGIKVVLPLKIPRESLVVRVLLRNENGAFGLVETPPLVVLTNMIQDFGSGMDMAGGGGAGGGGGGGGGGFSSGGATPPSPSSSVGSSVKSATNRETGPFMSSPVFLEPAQPWLQAKLPPGVHDPTISLPDHEGKLPATFPVLASMQEVTMWALGSGLPREANALRLRIGDSDGHEVKALEVPILTRRPAGIGMERFELAFTVPDLDPGTYSFDLTSTGIVAGMKFAGDLPFLVLVKPEASRSSWVQAQAAENAAAVSAATVAAAKREDEESAPAVREGYRAALRLLPTKGYGAVRDAVDALERETLLKGSSYELDKVLRAELSVARKVTGKEPRGLVILIRMHSELLISYDRTKAYIPAAHTRRMLDELAGLLASCGGDARTQAADLMAALASRFQRQGLHVSAERFYRHALLVDDTDANALLGLAAGLERAGNYKATVNTLSTLVKAHPDNPEGRLRLAVNLRRMQRRGDARDLFRKCTGEDNPTWVRAVAYQELARTLIEDDKLEAAEKLLDGGIQAVPTDFHLRVQQVAVLDRQHKYTDAIRSCEELRRLQLSREPSARLRYADWPAIDLDDALQQAHAMAPETMEVLKVRVQAEIVEPK